MKQPKKPMKLSLPKSENVDDKLLALFYKWLEYESCAIYPPGRSLPNEGYVWQKDKLDRYHHGSFNLATGRLVPGESSFNLIRSNVPQPYKNDKVQEFGAIFRRMEELWQGLVVMDCLGGEKGWREYLIVNKLQEKQAERLLDRIWLFLAWECRRRSLL